MILQNIVISKHGAKSAMRENIEQSQRHKVSKLETQVATLICVGIMASELRALEALHMIFNLI